LDGFDWAGFVLVDEGISNNKITSSNKTMFSSKYKMFSGQSKRFTTGSGNLDS
jgi:hypothetical protein